MPVNEKGVLCINAGESVVVHVASWKLERKRIRPRNRPGFVFMNVITLELDEVDGEAQPAEYLITSELLATAIKPLLDSGDFADRSITLAASGDSFRRRVFFQAFPRGRTPAPLVLQ